MINSCNNGYVDSLTEPIIYKYYGAELCKDGLGKLPSNPPCVKITFLTSSMFVPPLELYMEILILPFVF